MLIQRASRRATRRHAKCYFPSLPVEMVPCLVAVFQGPVPCSSTEVVHGSLQKRSSASSAMTFNPSSCYYGCHSAIELFRSLGIVQDVPNKSNATNGGGLKLYVLTC